MAITQENINSAINLAQKYGARRVLLFGTALTDPQNANDLDLGVEGIEPDKFLLFGADLEDLINKSVDIVPLELNSQFVEHIRKYGNYIYDETRIN